MVVGDESACAALTVWAMPLRYHCHFDASVCTLRTKSVKHARCMRIGGN
jgi:hypothetical protein